MFKSVEYDKSKQRSSYGGEFVKGKIMQIAMNEGCNFRCYFHKLQNKIFFSADFKRINYVIGIVKLLEGEV